MHGVGFPAVFRLAGALCLSLALSGCIFGNDSPDVDIRKPSTLSPENDLFAAGSSRIFSLSEGIIRTGKDTVFAVGNLVIHGVGDTVIGGETRRQVVVETSPAPAAVLSRLGLDPARLFFDTVALPDPGPGLRFPDTPVIGWRLDTTIGELHHVRRLTGVKTIKAAGQYQECWVFADSTYLGATAVTTGSYYMGARGLVLLRQEWPNYAPASLTGGTFWRETRAANFPMD